jgi:hypothetical protein
MNKSYVAKPTVPDRLTEGINSCNLQNSRYHLLSQISCGYVVSNGEQMKGLTACSVPRHLSVLHSSLSDLHFIYYIHYWYSLSNGRICLVAVRNFSYNLH